MTQGSGRFLRDNAFLVAAVSLPLLVVAFFLISSVIPRWTVAPPAYDLLLRTDGGYDGASPQVTVEYTARDGKVEATVRRLPTPTYQKPGSLFLFDHRTMAVREVPVELPRVAENDPPQTIVVDALAGRRVLTDPKAPDGYQFETRNRGGSPGIVGEIFGMNRYDQRAVVVKSGRVIPLELPVRYPYYYGVHAVGWLAN